MSSKTDPIAEAGERFAADTAQHEITIEHDEGLYRHLRFRRMIPQKDGTRWSSSFYWFDLITWPGCLAFNGDMGGYTFARTEDMFGFFRGHGPNPSYWAEKLTASSRVKEYSEDAFRRRVLDYYAGCVDSGGVPKGLGRAIRKEVLGSGDTYFEQGAMTVLDEFEYQTEGGKPWRFHDLWEWDLTDWSHPFLWCCHAIPYAIGQYDAVRAAVAA